MLLLMVVASNCPVLNDPIIAYNYCCCCCCWVCCSAPVAVTSSAAASAGCYRIADLLVLCDHSISQLLLLLLLLLCCLLQPCS
jgi:hypothetical protein